MTVALSCLGMCCLLEIGIKNNNGPPWTLTSIDIEKSMDLRTSVIDLKEGKVYRFQLLQVYDVVVLAGRGRRTMHLFHNCSLRFREKDLQYILHFASYHTSKAN